MAVVKPQLSNKDGLSATGAKRWKITVGFKSDWHIASSKLHECTAASKKFVLQKNESLRDNAKSYYM